MEGIKSFFESFKEFIWDILGYILPGAYFLILMSISIKNAYLTNINYFHIDKNYFPYIILIISYIIGYAVYGLNALIENTLKGKSYSKKIEEKTKDRINYKIAKTILDQKFQEKGIIIDINKATFRDLRSIAMSFFPEQDQKIYTFSFRADISNHAGTISLIFGIFGLVFSIINRLTPVDIFIIDIFHIVLYVFLTISCFLFMSMRNKFYAISLGLPFTLLTANSIK